MKSRKVLITTISLALILLAFSVQAALYYNSNSASVTQETEIANLSGTYRHDGDMDYHCGSWFTTNTYFSYTGGTNDPLTVTWSAPSTLPSSCVGQSMSFDGVEILVVSAGGHWQSFTVNSSNSSGAKTKNKDWVYGDTIRTYVTYEYLP